MPANTILTCISAPMLFLLRPRPSLLSMKFTSILRFLISTIKVLNSVYITSPQISVTPVNPTKLLTVEIVSSIYTIFNPLIISYDTPYLNFTSMKRKHRTKTGAHTQQFCHNVRGRRSRVSVWSGGICSRASA